MSKEEKDPKDQDTPVELNWLFAEKVEPGSKELEDMLDKYGAMVDTDHDEDQVRESLTRIFCSDESMQEILNLDDVKIRAFYENAKQRYESGKYADAESLFTMLYTLQPTRIEFIFGAAASQQQQQKYEAAIYSYNLVLSLDPDNAQAYFHLTDCWRGIGQLKAALNCNVLADIMIQKNPNTYGMLAPEVEKDFEKLVLEMDLDLEAATKAASEAKKDPVEELQEVMTQFSEGDGSIQDLADMMNRQDALFLPKKSAKKKGESS